MPSPVVAGYIRVSSARQRDESDSPASQRQRLEAAGCTTIYQDLAVSGFKLEQRRKATGFQQLITDITAGKIGRLLSVRLDRVARRDQIVIELAELCHQHGVEFATLSGGPVNVSTATGWLQVKVQSIFGEHYSRALSESIRAGYAGLHQAGIPARSAASLPFHLQRQQGTRHGVEPSPHWPAARRAVERIISGAWSIPQAARFLHEAAGLRGDSSDLKRWLRSPALIGHMPSRGGTAITMRSVYPPLIDEAERQQLLAILAATRGRKLPGTGPARLLTGICRCAICGGAMSYESVKRPAATYWYVRCRRQTCNRRAVAAGPVWDAITAQLDDHLEELVRRRAAASIDTTDPPEVMTWRRELAAREAMPMELRQPADDQRIAELRGLIAAADTMPDVVEDWWPGGLAAGSVQFWSQRPEAEINADLRRLIRWVPVDPRTGKAGNPAWVT